MKTANLICAMLVLVIGSVIVAAQTSSDNKEFNKDGLTFSYPNGWTMQDTSNSDAQQFNFGRTDTEAQFRLFVFRTHVNSPEKLAEAKKVLVDPYVNSTFRQFELMGAKPAKAPVTTDLGSVKSEGVKISAVLDGEPGAAEIHWGVVGNRLVVLTMFGPDNALKRAAPVWDTLRMSILVADPAAAPATPTQPPTPAQTPKAATTPKP